MTGIPAPNHFLSSSPDSIYSPSPKQYHQQVPILGRYRFPSSCPIPVRGGSDIATPPLTPDGGSDHSSDRSFSPTSQQKDALDFLMTLFPSGLGALPYSKSISISSPNMGSAFNGMVLQLPDKPKTLYVDAKSAESVSLRERSAIFCQGHMLGLVY